MGSSSRASWRWKRSRWKGWDWNGGVWRKVTGETVIKKPRLQCVELHVKTQSYELSVWRDETSKWQHRWRDVRLRVPLHLCRQFHVVALTWINIQLMTAFDGAISTCRDLRSTHRHRTASAVALASRSRSFFLRGVQTSAVWGGSNLPNL